MTRIRLPPRRDAERVKIVCKTLGGRSIYLTISRLPSGAIAEVFTAGAKIGSTVDMMIAEWATLLSIALQHGMPLAEYAPNVQRNEAAEPETPMGEIIDALSKL